MAHNPEVETAFHRWIDELWSILETLRPSQPLTSDNIAKVKRKVAQDIEVILPRVQSLQSLIDACQSDVQISQHSRKNVWINSVSSWMPPEKLLKSLATNIALSDMPSLDRPASDELYRQFEDFFYTDFVPYELVSPIHGFTADADVISICESTSIEKIDARRLPGLAPWIQQDRHPHGGSYPSHAIVAKAKARKILWDFDEIANLVDEVDEMHETSLEELVHMSLAISCLHVVKPGGFYRAITCEIPTTIVLESTSAHTSPWLTPGRRPEVVGFSQS